ncbi:DMT family transporter [Peribacillus sp. SCS-26]|uniref:DMT family transporter n=1 Tax=Paraperibacillus marinus TaxID=3115295 RepID=UPI00390681EF
MKALFPLLAFVGGLAIAVQAQVNGALGRKAGSIEAAFISFLLGTTVLFFVLVFFGKGNLLAVGSVPKWQLLGGLLGAFYVFVMVLTVPKIGVAATFVAVIAGQMILGLVIDHYGLMGGVRDPINAKKIMGILLLFASLYLFNKK